MRPLIPPVAPPVTMDDPVRQQHVPKRKAAVRKRYAVLELDQIDDSRNAGSRRRKAVKAGSAVGEGGITPKPRNTGPSVRHAHALNPIHAAGSARGVQPQHVPQSDTFQSGKDLLDPEPPKYLPIPTSRPLEDGRSGMFSTYTWHQPIVDEYNGYKWPVWMYQIDPVKAASNAAEAWLENTIFRKALSPNLRFDHVTKGFISGGNLLTFVIMPNASNPFSGDDVRATTTTIGVYGLPYKQDSLIRWTTFSFDLRYGPTGNELSTAERLGLIKKVRSWSPDMKASEKRFHRAYWLSANRKPLGNLLNHGAFSPEPEEDSEDGADDVLEMTKADIRNEDLFVGDKVSEEYSMAVWNRVLEATESDGLVDALQYEDHMVLWSSEWVSPEWVLRG
jgi:hypothetical protein